MIPVFAVEETAVDAVSSTAPAVHDQSIMHLMMGSGPVVQGVLIILVVMSLFTWGIVVTKWFQLSSAERQSNKFSDIFWGSRNLADINKACDSLQASPMTSIFSAGYKELSHVVKRKKDGDVTSDFGEIESIERALKRAKAQEVTRLEKGTTFLATTASAAPFIGLFGTVWGIMNAFIGLAHVKTSSIQAVAPGISEALIATAIGLAAAIPAAIFYNYYSQRLRVTSRQMDMFSSEFLNIASRNFLGK